MANVDCIVIGAGVIGLAVARALSMAGLTTVILERENTFGTVTSARNSEVIHAGLYYAPGSLKAKFCVQGRSLLYAFCEQHQVAHRRCGKLIVATEPQQIDALHTLAATAVANGVDDLVWLDAAQARALEPELHCEAALLSPSTGIIDTHAYMLALLGDAQRYGADLALTTSAHRLCITAQGISVHSDKSTPALISGSWIINAAGLDAENVARTIDGFPPEHIPQLQFAKGSYFSLQGRTPFSRLIYPLPEPGGLGVHLTLDLGNRARFGPDVEWINVADNQIIDYRVDSTRADNFYASIRRYWPQLQDGQLSPAYAGMRPKLSGPQEPAADFRIDGPATHGMRGIVNLFGIESPGITASLAIAEHVAEIVKTQN